ncbi:MAG: bifunctional folylpolyglutamate synthase/dihydrofolate synthase [Nitrospirales bacterium]
MSYQSCLEYLYGLQKYGIKLGLENIRTLLARLDHPHDRYPALHIGGTNGKGSTAAMAAAMLQAAGLRVGLYTSPHLIEFRERIQVGGVPISDAAVTDLTERLRRTALADLNPTFFEFTTALAFRYFAEMQVEVAVIEVGMGGRFDATNVVTPLVTAITNVALDHQAHLGETIEAIAFEKAGIIKPSVPIVTGRLAPESLRVIERIVADRQAPWWRLGREFRTKGETTTGFAYRGPQLSVEGLTCPLAGAHQMDNAACALALVEAGAPLGLRVPAAALQEGLRRVRWEGRLEVLEAHPHVVVDGAHNPAAAEAVAAYVRAYQRLHPGSRAILVVGMMRDKDQRGFFDVVLPTADAVVLTQATMPRAATVEELRTAVTGRIESVYAVPSPAEALAIAKRLATSEDLICITGSLMLVGELKALARGCEVSPIRG